MSDDDVSGTVSIPGPDEISVVPSAEPLFDWERLTPDVVLHVQTGMKDFSGDYVGRTEIEGYLNKFWSRVDRIEQNIQKSAIDENFVVLLSSTRFFRGDSSILTSLVNISLLDNDKKIPEMWMIASSLSNPEETNDFWGL